MKTILALAIICGTAVADDSDAPVREWSDATGRIEWDAELLAAGADSVLLRTKDGQLHAVVTAQLSKDDQEFVKKYLDQLNQEEKSDDPEEMQVWTGRDGLMLRARVLSYVSKSLEIKWKFRDVYINDRKLSEYDPVYQAMLPKIVAHVDNETVETDLEVRKWASQFRDKPRTITVDGVLMRLENGDEYVVPIFLFDRNDQSMLQAGWDKWRDEESTKEDQERENFLLRQQAAQLQQQKAADENRKRQIQEVQLGMMAVNAGITNIWEVLLTPNSGNGRPVTVMVPGANSGAARAAAAQKYPGYFAGAARQVSSSPWFRYR